MSASLSTAERRILEAAVEAAPGAGSPRELTDAVRRAVGQLAGGEFRQGVASLAARHLLLADVATKPNGEVGRVVIERITPLGRLVIRRATGARSGRISEPGRDRVPAIARGAPVIRRT